MNYAIEDLIAHDHPMILIDDVISHNDEMIETSLTINEDTPFMFDGKVPCYVAVEYMAQSIAAYSGIIAREKGEAVRIGFLLGTRKLELLSDGFLIGEQLNIEAKALYNDGEMASFDCVTKKGGKIVAKARLSVYQPSNDNLKMETKADG